MLRGVVIASFFVALANAEAAPIKKCGALDQKCVNNNFLQLQTELDSASQQIATLKAQVDKLTQQVNTLDKTVSDSSTGLSAQVTELSKLKGTVQLESLNPTVTNPSPDTGHHACLDGIDQGVGHIGFSGCHGGDKTQDFKIVPR